MTKDIPVALLNDAVEKMQIGQTRIIARAMEEQAKRYAMGELPRVSPQVALEGFAKALHGTVADMEKARAERQAAGALPEGGA